MKYLSREFIMSVVAFVLGLLAQFGVIVPDDLGSKITGAAVAVAALVAWIIGRTIQKKNGS